MLDEGDEAIQLFLSDAVNAHILNSVGMHTDDHIAFATIVDDEIPTITAGGFFAGEGQQPIEKFYVYLSSPGSEVVTVDYTVTPGTAVPFEDYDTVGGATGQLVFDPQLGDYLKIVQIQTYGDYEIEGEETLFITLSNPTNAVLGIPQAMGTLVDGFDPPITVYPSLGYRCRFRQRWRNHGGRRLH